jgi:hypothetical protein
MDVVWSLTSGWNNHCCVHSMQQCRRRVCSSGMEPKLQLRFHYVQVAVNKGFTPGAAFTATLSGSGELFLLGLNATDLTLTNNG